LLQLVIVANAATGIAWTGEVIVDSSLNSIGAANCILCSTQGCLVAPGEVVEKPSGSVGVTEVGGCITSWPLHLVLESLQPMEIQILRQSM
jgi:hypothetical protein